MIERLPTFVIIGAQKAASTFLLACLRQHPEAWLPAEEQPAFRDPLYCVQSVSDLAALYTGRQERRLGLKCPDYLGRPEVPARLHRDLDEPQLIVVLRNPVQRALSAYYWRMRWGLIPIAPPEEGLRCIIRGDYSDKDPSADEILTWGLYHQHLSRYLTFFPRRKILILFDEDIKRQPEAVMRETSEFLGIEKDVLLTRLRGADRNSGIYSLQRLRFLQRRNKYILRWDASGTYASIPRPSSLGQRLYSDTLAAVDQLFLSAICSNKRPALSLDLSAMLWEYYDSDVCALRQLVDRNLYDWTRLGIRP